MIRGNHECSSINKIYGFFDECKRRYSIKLWKNFNDCFNCLPVAAENDRGVSVTFDGTVIEKFLEDNDLDLVCRAHQVVEEGYEFFADRKLVTVFSAPNYCGEFDNAGAMMTVDENLKCSFQVLKPINKAEAVANNQGNNRGITPPKKK